MTQTERTNKYRQTEKGKAAFKKYEQSDKSKERIKRYRATEKAKLLMKISNKRFRDSLRGRAKRLFDKAKERAHNKNLPFTITIDEIETRLERGVCEATGSRLIFDDGRANPYGPSLDQKIPGKGYAIENCQVVALWYNRLKLNMTDEQTKKLIQYIKEL